MTANLNSLMFSLIAFFGVASGVYVFIISIRQYVKLKTRTAVIYAVLFGFIFAYAGYNLRHNEVVEIKESDKEKEVGNHLAKKTFDAISILNSPPKGEIEVSRNMRNHSSTTEIYLSIESSGVKGLEKYEHIIRYVDLQNKSNTSFKNFSCKLKHIVIDDLVEGDPFYLKRSFGCGDLPFDRLNPNDTITIPTLIFFSGDFPIQGDSATRTRTDHLGWAYNPHAEIGVFPRLPKWRFGWGTAIFENRREILATILIDEIGRRIIIAYLFGFPEIYRNQNVRWRDGNAVLINDKVLNELSLNLSLDKDILAEKLYEKL